jgi:translation initiation factor IF-1
MVKNDKGGKGAKSLARKAVSNAGSSRLQLSTCDEEQYACVTNMYGNGMCEVYTNANVKLICHIRNKFRGRQKRSNIVTRFSLVLVGLRDYEITPKNCDLLCIYDDQEIEQLKNIPNINISHILQLRMNHLFNANGNGGGDTSDVLFTNDIEEELDIKNNNKEYEFKLETTEEIDIEDI